MNHPTSTLRGLLGALIASAVLPAVTASAEDRFRIPLPPPPGEVIRDVRGFIHNIGRGIKRGAQKTFNDPRESDERERDLPRPRRDQGPNGEWDGKFYPDEYDKRGARPPQERQAPPPRDIPAGTGGWTSEEQLRREAASRDAAQNYQPSEMPPAISGTTRKKNTLPPSEGVHTPTPPPQTSPSHKQGGVKESAPPSTASSTTPKPAAPAPSSEVQYGSPVPGKQGLVYPPGVEKKPENMVDVADFKPGQLVRNPRNGELFRVP